MTWISPTLKTIGRLKFAELSPESRAHCAYALRCCRFAAAASPGEFREQTVRVCDRRLKEMGHLSAGASQPEALRAASVRVQAFGQDLSRFSVAELVALHSLGHRYSGMRRKAGLEPMTRIGQWRIVSELARRDGDSPLATLMLLAEYLEADNHARILSLPYSIGQRPRHFRPADFDGDEALAAHIKQLSRRPSYVAREELVDIADHIQAAIVDLGTAADHLPLVNAILSTDMPQFNYPKILKALENATKTLARSSARSRMELAPAYYVLWSNTLNTSYLNQYESTVRHCYLALATDRTYPGLGIDRANPRSLHAAARFLNENRQSLWVLNPGYDVDKLIRRYTLQTG